MKATIAAGLAAFGLAAAAPQASAFQEPAAQSPVIVVVNQQAVLTQSKAGQSVAAQIEKLGETVQAELTAEAEKIRAEGERLQQQRELLAEDAFAEQVRAFQVRQQGLAQLREKKLRELQIAEQQALGKIGEAMRPILEEIVNTRGATIMLDRAQVMFAVQETDITAEVLTKLNENLATVAVERVDLDQLAEELRAAQETAANAQAGEGGQ
ncbi:MAG: OmpH family outer membrane protein [Pseudomonadota bacterium]